MMRLVLVFCAASLAMSSVRADDTVRTCASFTTYRDFSFHRFEKGYVASLRFHVPAVVESALREVAAIKLAQPGLRSDGLYATICDLANEAETPAVRYKAGLVRLVFDFPELFDEERGREYRNDQDLFTALQNRLHRSALVLVH